IDAYGLKEVNHVWTLVDTGLSAAEKLATKKIDNRAILTYDSDKKEGVEFEWDNLTDDMKDDLNTGPDGKSDTEGKARLNYIRGDHADEGTGTSNFRQRAILASGNTSRLGDMVHSSPVYVGAPGVDWPDEFPVSNPSEPYSEFVDREEKRTSIIYAGANDGMLHGFDSETLEEVLAYIPSNLFSDEPDEGLHYLTQRDYAHRYYVDLTPSVSDVFINGKWHTVLVGGQRAGGKGYFALDVTDPDNFDKDDVLWEFTHPDLGYTYSHPQIGMMNDGTWVAIFGNGYNNEGSGKAELFIVDIATGKKIKQISTEVGGTGSDRNGLATPALADLDLNGTIDRAYAGDLEGNMWAFDLSGDASAWKLDYKLFATEGAQPITTKPTLSFHPTVRTTVAPSKDANEPNIMVYFGSGQYLVDSDLTINTNTPADYFYGVWDNGKVALDSELVEQTISTADYKGVEFRFMSNNSVDYAKNTPDKGWKIKLPDLGERHITNPIVRGNVVYFNTSVPNSESCSGGGYGYRMAVDLGTGGSPKDPAIDIDQDGIVTKHDKTGTGEIPSGGKLAKLPSDPTMTEGKVIQDGAILDLQDLPDIKTGRFSWQELLR
ncbi:MAG: hypothetical protein GY784_08240, partial [Gammaproteobacteria bacterium]|nr:hypothetical protein [Gammaproteobacteria bacterium]